MCLMESLQFFYNGSDYDYYFIIKELKNESEEQFECIGEIQKSTKLFPFQSLHKMPLFHLIFWCGNVVGRHSFCMVSGGLPKPMRRMCLYTNFLQQEIRWNYVILHCGIEKEVANIDKEGNESVVTISYKIHYQILLIISQKEFIKLNVKIVIIFLNMKLSITMR